MIETDPTRAFLDAFSDIEKVLRSKAGSGVERPFGALVGELSRTETLVRQHASALRAFASLRNAISHERYRQGLPIAIPNPELVEAIERIRDQFANPPKIGALVQGRGPVQTVAPEDGVWGALRSMTAKSHSQSLVYGKDGYAGLLTTNSIARWVASQANVDGSVLMDEGAVADVLEHAEGFETASFVARDRLVTDVVEMFNDTATAPVAVVVTHNGKPSERPLGIVVVHDLPDLLSEVAVL